MKLSLLSMLAAGLMGVGLYVANASASDQCWDTTSGWFDQGKHYTCWFESGGRAEVSSLSGEVNPGQKGVIADLMSTSGISGWDYAYSYAVGINSSGQEMSGCRTQNDRSTAQGQTVGDGTGCNLAVKHRLYAVKATTIR